MKRLILLLIVASSALLLGACFKVDSNFAEVRDVVLAEVEGSHGGVVEVHLGGLPLAMSRVALGFVDEPEVEEALRYAGRINSIELGVYEFFGDDGSLRLDHELKEHLDGVFNQQGFERMLTHREQGEWVSIYTGLPEEGAEVVREMFVVVVDSEECVLVRLGGDLSGLVRAAAQERLHELDWRELMD